MPTRAGINASARRERSPSLSVLRKRWVGRVRSIFVVPNVHLDVVDFLFECVLLWYLHIYESSLVPSFPHEMMHIYASLSCRDINSDNCVYACWRERSFHVTMSTVICHMFPDSWFRLLYHEASLSFSGLLRLVTVVHSSTAPEPISAPLRCWNRATWEVLDAKSNKKRVRRKHEGYRAQGRNKTAWWRC